MPGSATSNSAKEGRFTCGHPIFQESSLSQVPNEEVYIQSWKWTAGPDPDHFIGISPRVYHQYLNARETLFETFPQLDTELLEAAARECTSSKSCAEGDQEAHGKLMCKLDEMSLINASEQAVSNLVEGIRFHTLHLVDGDELTLRPDHLARRHPWNEYVSHLLQQFEEAGGKRQSNSSRCNGWLTTVTLVDNPGLQGRFDQCKNKFEKKMGGNIQREYILYHGTSPANANIIVQNGFDSSRIKSKPYGFYFASYPGLPMCYGGPGNVILMCKVLLGEILDENQAFSGYHGPQRDADSLIRGGSSGAAPMFAPPPAAPAPPPVVTNEAAQQAMRAQAAVNNAMAAGGGALQPAAIAALQAAAGAMAPLASAEAAPVGGAPAAVAGVPPGLGPPGGAAAWVPPPPPVAAPAAGTNNPMAAVAAAISGPFGTATQGVTPTIFIIQRPEQILPIGMLRFKHPDHPFVDPLDGELPPGAYPGDVGPSVPPPRQIAPARLHLTEVDTAVSALRRAALERPFMPQEIKREIDRKTSHIEQLKMDYLSRYVCSKCGLENTKMTSVAFNSFLEFHDRIMGSNAEDHRSELDGFIDECNYDDYDEEMDDLYESESEEENDEENDDVPVDQDTCSKSDSYKVSRSPQPSASTFGDGCTIS